MKAISLWQPWASAMALGLKRIETRHWSTNYRGPMAIHAAKRLTRDERDLAEEFAVVLNAPQLEEPPLGAIIAVGVLTDIKPAASLLPHISGTEAMLGNYGTGRFGWVFSNVVALPEPVPFRGLQGLFDVPDDIVGAEPPMAAQADMFEGKRS